MSTIDSDELRQVLDDFRTVQEQVTAEETIIGKSQTDKVLVRNDSKISYLLMAEATVKNLNGLSSLLIDFIADKEIYLGGDAAINDRLPKDLHEFNTNASHADYHALTNSARQFARDLVHALEKHATFKGRAQVVSHRIHPHQVSVRVDDYILIDFQQVSQTLLDAIDCYRNADNVRFCGPLWMRMIMYQQLSQPHTNPVQWGRVYQRLQSLNEHSSVASLDLQKQCVHDIDSMLETDYEQFIHQDELHQDLYRGILAFIQTRHLALFGVSVEAWYLSSTQVNDTNVSQFLTARPRRDEPEFSALSTAAEQDANELVSALKQYLYQDDINVSFHVEKRGKEWVFDEPSYAVVMIEKLHEIDGSVRELRETLIEFYSPHDKCYSTIMIGQTEDQEGVCVLAVSSLINLMILQYFRAPRVHLRNRLLHTIERLLDLIHRHPEDVLKGKYAQVTFECYGDHNANQSHADNSGQWHEARRRILATVHKKQAERMYAFEYKPATTQ